MLDTFAEYFQETFRGEFFQSEWQRLSAFLFFLALSIVIGKMSARITALIASRFTVDGFSNIYQGIFAPIQSSFQVAGTVLGIALSFNILKKYDAFAEVARPFVDLALILSLAWLASRLFRQVVRYYGVEVLQRFGREVNELLLVFETLANVIIGFVAALAFAQSQQFNLIGLLASLGLGGLAIAFAAQKILEQFLSALVLYLDRPFIPGDYIRISGGELGRVESIGLRSTKIRALAKSTVRVIPNSTLVNQEIENVTRAKKVMCLLYLDFERPLEEQDGALVRQVIEESTNSLFGIDPGSTNISLIENARGLKVRARVTFFILGSYENSISLRKRLLELANENITQRLAAFDINFRAQEPTIYVESPVTI